MPPIKIKIIRKINFIKAVIHYIEIWRKEREMPDWQLAKVNDKDFYIEKKLYLALKDAGYKVKTHVIFGSYEVDLYLPKYRLVIEADGYAFHSSPEQKERDRMKERVLKKVYKLKVRRFTSKQITKRTDWCVEKVAELVGRPRQSIWKKFGQLIKDIGDLALVVIKDFHQKDSQRKS